MNRKAELKADYKHNGHKLRKMGVYAIRNMANGKVFLDKSSNLEGAIERDRLWLARGGHMNAKLQQDWNLHGAAAFTFEILEAIDSTDEPKNVSEEIAVMLEVWLDELQPYGDKGYLPVPRPSR